MKVSEPPVVVSQTYDVRPEKLWSAITNIDEMRIWYFDTIEDFKPTVGFKTSFLIENEGRLFTHQWEVKEVVEGKRIKYQWNYKEHEGDSYVLFEINEIAKTQSSLTLSCIVEKDYPDHIPEFDRSSCVAGWEYFLKERLVDYLKK